MKTLVVIGSGGHGRIVAEAAALSGDFRVLGFADENLERYGKTVDDWKVLGHWRELHADGFIVAIGDNTARKRIWEELISAGRNLENVIAKGAFVSRQVRLTGGTVILSSAAVQAGAKMGPNIIVNAGGVIDHDAEIGSHAHVGLNCTVQSFAKVAEGETLAHGSIRLRA